LDDLCLTDRSNTPSYTYLLEEDFRHLATVRCCYVEDIDHHLDREEGFIDIRPMCALGYLQFADPGTVS
jgi:hypothetical protein